MLNSDSNKRRDVLWPAILALLGIVGCFGPANLPTELEVVLPQDQRELAVVGMGVDAFANETLAIFRKADAAEPNEPNPPTGPYGGLLNGGFLDRPEPDTVMFRAVFDDDGRAERIFDNAFYEPELFGDALILDGEFHGTTTPGLTYASAFFGVSRENQFGLAIPAEVRFFGVPLGTALVYAWGTIAEGRADGTFGYQADLNALPDLLLGSGGDQYPIYATVEP